MVFFSLPRVLSSFLQSAVLHPTISPSPTIASLYDVLDEWLTPTPTPLTMAAATEALKPFPVPLPALPSGDFMTAEQWETLYALMDGALPGYTSKSKAASSPKSECVAVPDDEFELLVQKATEMLPKGKSREDLERWLAENPVQSDAIRQDTVRTLSFNPSKEKLGPAMSLLNTHLGSLLLTGYWTPISQQPSNVRHAILQSWVNSSIPLLRTLAKTATNLALKTTTVTSSSLFSLTGYTDSPTNWQSVEGYPYEFIQLEAASAPHVIETDVVVVGTGPGGGVSAKNLAEAGHRVLVVDKGYYFPPSQFPMNQLSGLQYLYDNSSPIITDNGCMSVLAGSCWGGGGTINWSVSLRTQDYVRKEWAQEKKLPFFGTKKYDECLDRVCHFVGAGTDGIRHNFRNTALLEGSAKLGWKAAPVPQNTANKEHYCGRCTLGCGAGEKNGPATSWLPAAAEAGAEFMEGFKADKVLFADDGKTATGVEGEWLSRGPGGDVSSPESERVKRRVQIKAKRVIVSCGTLQSPLLLKRSGIENPQVGRNLHLHPANVVTATFPDDQEGWEGGIITSCNSEFENLDQKGHGVKIETTCMVPFACLSAYPWKDGLDAKLLLARFNKLASFVTIVRDRDTGTVFPDPKTGGPRVDYQLSEFDREHSLQGMEALAKICYVQGATEFYPYIPGLPPLKINPASVKDFHAKLQAGQVKDPEFSDPALKDWLKKLWTIGRSKGLDPLACAHQMGSCRMSATEEEGVVDGKGKVWGREGLFVADSSVFPSASGVNPMVTTMAIADWISRGVAEGLR